MSSLSITTHGHGQPLVLLHGWGFSSQIWSPLLPKLIQHFRVIAIDLPGHGESLLLPHLHALEKIAEQLIHHTPPNAIWLGWSLGGLLATQVAHQYSQHVRQLLLVASTPKFVTSPDWEYGIAPEVLEKFSVNLQANTETTLTRFVALQTMGSPNARQETRELSTHIKQHLPTKTGLNWGLQILKNTDMRPVLPTLTMPVHCLFGAKDTLVALALAEHLPQNYPNIRTHVLTESAHMPFYSHPELFLPWLQRSCNL